MYKLSVSVKGDGKRAAKDSVGRVKNGREMVQKQKLNRSRG